MNPKTDVGAPPAPAPSSRPKDEPATIPNQVSPSGRVAFLGATPVVGFVEGAEAELPQSE